MPKKVSLAFPINIKNFDHYTLITSDAKKSADFHVKVLGFKYIKSQPINTGTASEGNFDMENHVLQLPNSSKQTCVITQGLTERSIFSQYIKKYGEGIHHMAYAVNNLENVLALLVDEGIETTSKEILTDPISGLRQIFLCRSYAGYFIELIERFPSTKNSTYSDGNMKKLALTMDTYVK